MVKAKTKLGFSAYISKRRAQRCFVQHIICGLNGAIESAEMLKKMVYTLTEKAEIESAIRLLLKPIYHLSLVSDFIKADMDGASHKHYTRKEKREANNGKTIR